MNRRNRRGFTLTELVIVLAVLAIVSTMVISFTAMVTNSRQLSSARLDALGDVRVAEAVIESFIEENEITTEFKKDQNNNTIPVENKLEAGDKSIELLIENEDYKLVVKNGNETESNITLERVTKIAFDEYGNEDNTDKIYYCTIEYKVGNHVFDYTFCVNPYVGESVGGQANE